MIKLKLDKYWIKISFVIILMDSIKIMILNLFDNKLILLENFVDLIIIQVELIFVVFVCNDILIGVGIICFFFILGIVMVLFKEYLIFGVNGVNLLFGNLRYFFGVLKGFMKFRVLF